MYRKSVCLALFVFFYFSVAGLAYGDDNAKLTLSDFAKKNKLPHIVISKSLEDPETCNKVLEMVLASDPKWRFLKDFNLKFKTFKSNDGEDQALGFSYNFSKDINKRLFKENSANQAGLSFSINLEGNVAFDNKTNPNDFLNSNLSLHAFRSQGGAITVTDNVKTKLNELEDMLAAIEDKDDLFKSPIFKTFADIMLKNMSNQFYVDFSLIGGLESNQSFTEKQYYYGGQLGFDAKAWNPNSILAQYNVFDWPFATIRWLSGTDSTFSTRGSTIPTVLIGVDLVDPQSGVIKEVHSGKSILTRLRTEASFRTPIVEVMRNELAYFEANYRYYKEVSASEEAKIEKLVNFEYFAAALILTNGIYISYSTGKLPIDSKSDQVYELGFEFNF